MKIAYYFRWLGFCILFFIPAPYALAQADNVELLDSHASAFGEIGGMGFSVDGKLYALDRKSGSLVNCGPGTACITKDISAGLGKSPRLSGFAWLDSSGYAVTDLSTAAISIINLNGKTESGFGEKGNKAGMLKEPLALAYSVNNRLYAADAASAQISVFNRDGIFLYALGQAAPDPKARLKQPSQVGVDYLERVYVLEPGSNATVSIYHDSGEIIKRFDAEQLKALLGAKIDITALAVDAAGRLFLADSAAGKILQLDWQSGKVLQSFGSKGKGPGQYQEAVALALSADNRIAVADASLKKIDIYQLAGGIPARPERAWLANVGQAEFLPAGCDVGYSLHNLNILCLNRKQKTVQILDAKAKPVGSLNAKFKEPVQAAFNDKNIVVLDDNKVFVFNVDGSLVTEFGKSGSGDGQFKGATDIFLSNNRIYVAEKGNKRVQIFSLKGVYLNKLSTKPDKEAPVLLEPASLAVDSNGNIYVADLGKNSILVFSGNRELMYEIGEPAPSPGAFKSIVDLALDTDNNLYVLGSTGLKEQTVQVYNGPSKVFEFGAFSKKDPTGIGLGTAISVSPTERTLVSVFDIGDAKNPGLINFNFLQAPAPVAGLRVAGGVDASRLEWSKPPGNYIAGYKIYGANDKEGSFEFIAKSDKPIANLGREQGGNFRFYKVSAVNGFGMEGPMSAARESEFLKAQAEYEKQNYSTAVEILLHDLEDNPGQPDALKLLGQSYIKMGRHELAAQQFSRLTQLDGYKTEGINLQIEALYLGKDYVEAMALMQSTLGSTERNVASYINCGRLSLKIGDAVGAASCLEDGLKLDAVNPDINFLLAQAYTVVGAVDKGIAQLEKTLKFAPGNASLWLRSGELYRSLGKLETAQKQYEQALKLEPDNAQAQLGLARTLLDLKQLAKAKNIAFTLAGKTEMAATGNYLLGLIALQEKNAGEAVLALGKATRAEPDNAGAWLALADAYAALGKPEEQTASLRGAMKADPLSFDTLQRLGKNLLEHEKFEEASETLTQAARLKPDDYAVQFAAAQALYKANKFNLAADFSKLAVKLKSDKAEPLLLAAQIARQGGKTGEAIEFLKSAAQLDKANYDIRVQLGGLYLDNNLYEQARTELDQAVVINKLGARAHVLLGALYSRQRQFDKAIAELEQAVKFDGSTDNKLLLETAYADKKRSLEFSNNAPQVALEKLQLSPVFSAAYKQYTDKPVGTIDVKNVSGTAYGNLVISFQIKGYMDFPTQQTIASLSANSTQTIPLKAAFNNKVLEIDEDTGVQVEVKLSYTREGQSDGLSVTSPMTIYGKNAIVWGNPNMVGSFVTPKDDALRDFVRQLINEYKPEAGPMNTQLVSAMTLFNALSAYGIRYVIDPSNPFSSLKSDQVDYVQFGRETLRLKSGDCDDLSVLLSAALENLGIETAILDVPGHVLLMFNTGLEPRNSSLISARDDLVVIHDNSVWVPVEATMITASFAEAWAEGARKFYEYKKQDKLKIIPLKQAWQNFQPVTLTPSSYELKLPDADRVRDLIGREQKILLEKSLERLVESYRAMIASDQDNENAHMQIAIIYAKYGLYESANAELDKILQKNQNSSAVYNNRGNIYYNRGDLERAQEAYVQAERLDPSDGGIKMNLALAAYQSGQMAVAREKYQQAVKLNKDIADKYETFSKLLSR
ncbi:MAG TPA: tetratricopeptide repeat protein [Gammaproteobacteria bacterium]|nr:tetratricopeptide repeat protein [Gammaproteobacteria bacterium]